MNIQYGDNTTTTPVTINIQDVNDNVPTFNRKTYYASVPENTTNIPLTFNGSGVHVKDIDQVFSDIPKLIKKAMKYQAVQSSDIRCYFNQIQKKNRLISVFHRLSKIGDTLHDR